MFHKRELLKLEPPKNKKADEYLDAMEKLDVVLVFYKKTVDHMRMLLVDIFCRNGDIYRVFIHKISSEKGGYEYITYSYSTKRWLTSTFTSMRKANDNGWFQFVVYDRNVAYINREDACEYFHFENSDRLLSKIDGRLYQAVSHKQWVKHKQLNDFMKGMPEPSKRQIKWMENLFSDNLVGFIKGKTVFCEKCRKTTTTNTVLKSGDKLKCPYCKSMLHLHGTNFRGGRDGIQENAYIITKHKGKAVIRHFKVVKYFSEDHTTSVGCYEFSRDIVEDKKIVKCERDTYQTWRKGRHNDYDSYFHYSPFCAGYLYRGNYKRAVANTPMQYCGFEFTDKSTEIKWDMVLTAYLRYPMLESLIKVGGFCRLAVDIIETVDSKIRHYYNPYKKHLDMLNPNATTLSSFLGISKNLLPDIVSDNFTLERLERASKLYKSCYSLRKEEILMLSATDEAFDFIEASKLAHLSLHKVMRYIKEQNSTVGFYKKYLEECSKLGLDLCSSRVNLTRDLNAMYTKVFSCNQSKENKQLTEDYSKLYSGVLSVLNTQIDTFIFTVPRNFAEFVKQGAEMKQCIARDNSYFKDVIANNSILVFISDKNGDMNSRFTCKLEAYRWNKSICSITCLGYDNKSRPNKKQKQVIAKFEEYVNEVIAYKNNQFILREQPQLASA